MESSRPTAPTIQVSARRGGHRARHGGRTASRSSAAGGPIAGVINTSWLFDLPASTVAHSPRINPNHFGQSAHHSIQSALDRLDALCLSSAQRSGSLSSKRAEELAPWFSPESSADSVYLENKQLFHILASERRDRVLASTKSLRTLLDQQQKQIRHPSGHAMVTSPDSTDTSTDEDTEESEAEEETQAEGEQTITTILGRQKLEVQQLLKKADWQSLKSSDMLPVPPACRPQLSSIIPPKSAPLTSRHKPTAAPSSSTSPSPPSSCPPTPTLITISVHHPQHPNARTHELVLVASQHTLADLRDHIFCPTDYMSEEDKLRNNDPRAGHRKSSPSVFVIDGAMYIDGRAGYRALDAAVPIIKHFQSRGMEQEQMKRYAMEETVLADICAAGEEEDGVRINVPYVFVHQNGCEHMIVVQDIRLANPSIDDIARLGRSPLVTFRAVNHLPPCAYCHQRASQFITYGDACAMQSPCYWCSECYNDVHYNKRTGELVYSDYSVHEIVREQDGDCAG